MKKAAIAIALCCTVNLIVAALLPALAQSRIEPVQIESEQFGGNRIGIGSVRDVQVYLPDGYDGSGQRYPVLYGFHTFFEDETALFGQYGLAALLDRAIADGRLPPVIVVTPDFSTPAAHSLFTNSAVTGNWESYMMTELVPYIDGHYRTLPSREKRGLFGNHIGGLGAIKFAARYPDTFGSVYALHPVSTGIGHATGEFPDWESLQAAQTMDDIAAHWALGIVTAFHQACLPDPDNPPFYFTPSGRSENGRVTVDGALKMRLQACTALSEEVPVYAENMKRLTGFKFDWARADSINDHIYGNQHYTRLLRTYGVPHEAEEYNGTWDENVFTPGGRVDSDLFPFFARMLTVE